MGVAGEKFTQKCEWIALFFLTVCFFVSAISVSLTTVTYFCAFLFLLLSGDWRARWVRIRDNPAALSFWILAALLIVGVFYSTSTPPLIIRELHKQHWLFMTPLFIALLTREHWRQKMVNAFLYAMIITLFLSCIKSIFHFQFFQHIPYTKALDDDSVFENHIVQSFAMNIAAFICAYRCLFEKKYRLIYATLFVLMGINIFFMSDGRTGYGIFVLLFCYLGVIRFGWKGCFSAAFLAIAILSVVCVASHNFRSRMMAIYDHTKNYSQLHESTSIGQRIEMLGIAKQMIAQRPWFGYGTGGIRTALPTIVPAKDRVFNPSIDYVESIYLDYLLEFGVFGLLIFLSVIAVQIKTTYQLPQEYRYLMQATLIAILFGGFFNGFLVSFPFSHFYALFSALCFSALPVRNYD